MGAICLLATLVVLFRHRSDAPRTASVVTVKPVVMTGSATQPARRFGDASPSVSSNEIDVEQIHLQSTLAQIAAALWRIGNQSSPDRQTVELQNLVNEIPVADISVVLKSLQPGKSAFLDSEFRVLLIRRWTEKDAPTAADWIAQNLTGQHRDAALSSVATVWAALDGPGAENWARQLPDAGERSAAMLAIASELNRDDPLSALALAAELPESQNRDEFIVQSASAWGADAFRESVEWAGQIPNESLRHRVISAIAAAAAESDPAAAATLAVQSLPGGKEQDDAVVGIVQRWVQKEPEQAAAWVAAFPPGKLRDAALESVIKLWADKDLAQAGVWVNGFSSSASRDVAVAAYVGKVAVQFPEMAVEWVREISNERLRSEQMENLAELWLRSDAIAARKWISEAPLSAETKSRLLAPSADGLRRPTTR